MPERLTFEGMVYFSSSLVWVLAAAVLASCAGEKPTRAPLPPSTPFTCAQGENSNMAFLSPEPGNVGRAVSFDVGSVVAPFFPSTYVVKWNTPGGVETEVKGDPNRTTIVCEKVVNLGDYVIVLGVDNGYSDEARIRGDVPDRVAYVFKMLPSSPSGLGFVGTAPNFGRHEHMVIVKNYKDLGDLLVMGSQVMYVLGSGLLGSSPYYPENNQMLDAIAQALGFKNYLDKGVTKQILRVGQVEFDASRSETTLEELRQLQQQLGTNTEVTLETIGGGIRNQYGAKISVYKLGGQISAYSPNVKPAPVVLEKIATRPLLLARDVKLQSMVSVLRDGEPWLEVTASAWSGGARRRGSVTAKIADIPSYLSGSLPEIRTSEGEDRKYDVGPSQASLQELVENGILPAVPLLKR